MFAAAAFACGMIKLYCSLGICWILLQNILLTFIICVNSSSVKNENVLSNVSSGSCISMLDCIDVGFISSLIL